MPWQQISLPVTSHEREHVEDFFWASGAVSITYTDAQDTPVLEPAPNEVRLWEFCVLTALFDIAADANSVRQTLAQQLNAKQEIQINRVEDRDWERAWMDDFKPMCFGERLWICPSNMEIPSPEAINLRLDPGLAFGSGTHATTTLCLQWLDQANLKNKTVLDFGCGSGVLAIAALMLGAADTFAVDIDPQALIATAENAKRNRVAQNLQITDAKSWVTPGPMQVILANILAGPLISLAEYFAEMQNSGGKLVLSGILENQVSDIANHYQAYYELQEPVQRDGWVRINGQRK